MNRFLNIFIVISYYVPVIFCDPYFRRDYKYVPLIGGWMKVRSTPISQAEAKFRCQVEGAVLMSPLNKKLFNTMTVAANSVKDKRVHTGLNSVGGDFISVEGVPLSEMPYPVKSNEGGEYKDCMILSGGGYLKSEYCDTALPYICYKMKTEDYYKTECGTYDTSYQLKTLTGKCYKFHTNSMTWGRAQLACTAEGGHLPILKTQNEANLLVDIYDTYPLESLSSRYKYSLFLGVSNIQDLWTATDGRQLSRLFHTWAPNQPNNLKTEDHPEGQACLALATNYAALDDLWCSEPLSFICEKDPNHEPDDSDEDPEDYKIYDVQPYDSKTRDTDKLLSKPKTYVTRRVITTRRIVKV